jgi:hypothetical protein
MKDENPPEERYLEAGFQVPRDGGLRCGPRRSLLRHPKQENI